MFNTKKSQVQVDQFWFMGTLMAAILNQSDMLRHCPSTLRVSSQHMLAEMTEKSLIEIYFFIF